ncbi:SusC/RagA family TonB-linked outer membrane protein [Pseudopedobacter beijingensis]|uniref:SusC/RagA family TonB-linked outer membrane protein n=1 Tax=Pseudopedobacter beijingensis TaxID=1207056 RepID=A0ABW4ID16_9SPHI
MYRKRHLLTLCLCSLLLFFKTVRGQNETRVVTGNIKDESGQTVIGCVLIVESTGKRTMTDGDGNFSIGLPKGTQKVKITSIGFKDKTITVDEDNNFIEIVLSENAIEMDEVIVVGYGTQKKSSITNAVESINFKDLENIPQSNTIDLLSGRIAGLSVTSVGGEPGADDSEVKLRGTVTSGIAISPLIIIDGVQAGLKEFSTLSPAEIQEITVLKDASSTAIYGSRGANGVILVTTKQPAIGKVKFNLNSSYALQDGIRLPKMVESWQWMILQNEAGYNNVRQFTEEEISRVRSGIYNDSLANYNPVASLFRTAPQVITNLSMNGGTKDLSFQGSFGYLNQEGIMYNTGSDRINYRLNVKTTMSKKLEAGFNISGYTQNKNEAYTKASVIFKDNLYRSIPINPERYTNGEWGVYSLALNEISLPARLVAEQGRTDILNKRLTIIPSLIYRPVKSLTITSNFSYTSTIAGEERFNPTYTYYVPNGTSVFNRINSLYKFNSSSDQLQTTSLATYRFNIKKAHVFTAMVGYEFMDFKRDRFSGKGNNLATNEKQVLDQVTTDITTTGMKQHWAYQSVFSRINYAYRNKYFAEANIRRDGSSRLPKDKRYNSFPSVSAGWMVSKEEFFEKINPGKVLDQLKFRASWGKTGNDIVGVRNYHQTYEFSGYYTIGDEVYGGAMIHEFANLDLSWITATTTNLGLDIAMLKNKLDVTVDVYRRMHNGVIFYLDFPPSIENATQRFSRNLANVLNNGVEVSVKYRNAINKLNYHIGVNYARNTNEIVSLLGPEAIQGPFITRIGAPFNSIYGYVYDGIIKNAGELATTPVLGGENNRSSMKIGAMKFKDISGPDGVPDGIIDFHDRTTLGASQIPYELGLTGGVSYKGFDLSFLFYGVKGKQIYVRDYGNLPGTSIHANFWEEWWDNRYSATDNPEGTWPVFTSNGNNLGVGEVSSFWVHNADFIRLKNLEFGYTMSDKFSAKVGVNRLRFYFSGQNLLTFTSLIKQVDPERFSRQMNNQTYPQVRMLTGGVNISF